MNNDYENIDDYEQISRYLAGDLQAFDNLYGKYKKPLYNYLCTMLSPSEADDVFQNLWVKVLDKLAQYENSGQFGGWLFRIGRNLAIDYLRKNKRCIELLSVDGDLPDKMVDNYNTNSATSSEMKELRAALDDAVKQLPPEQREVFVCRQNNISFQNIASLQKCSLNTALSRMQYALLNLRKSLKSWQD